MTHQHFVVVVYDIPNDKRRTKLHTKLKDFGTPVQYSVFECIVNDSELEKMKKVVQHIIKPRLDHVRYYFLCGFCQKRIQTTQAGQEVSSIPEVFVM